MGTNTPKNYSSHLRLVDKSRNVDRTVKIWMNNPLRFAGETFYQSNYGRDAATRTEYTGLQVVTNTGWRIPYVSCMIVAVGMLAQFWVTLGRYPSATCRGATLVTAEHGDPTHDQPARDAVAEACGKQREASDSGGRPPEVAGRLGISAGGRGPLRTVAAEQVVHTGSTCRGIGSRRIRPLARHVRRAHQAARYAGSQQSADRLRSPGFQGRERYDAAGDALAVGRDHGLRSRREAPRVSHPEPGTARHPGTRASAGVPLCDRRIRAEAGSVWRTGAAGSPDRTGQTWSLREEGPGAGSEVQSVHHAARSLSPRPVAGREFAGGLGAGSQSPRTELGQRDSAGRAAARWRGQLATVLLRVLRCVGAAHGCQPGSAGRRTESRHDRAGGGRRVVRRQPERCRRIQPRCRVLQQPVIAASAQRSGSPPRPTSKRISTIFHRSTMR